VTLPLVDQAACTHTWNDESELVDGSRLVCVHCGLAVVAYPWRGLWKAVPERRNPLGLVKHVSPRHPQLGAGPA